MLLLLLSTPQSLISNHVINILPYLSSDSISARSLLLSISQCLDGHLGIRVVTLELLEFGYQWSLFELHKLLRLLLRQLLRSHRRWGPTLINDLQRLKFPRALRFCDIVNICWLFRTRISTSEHESPVLPWQLLTDFHSGPRCWFPWGCFPS